MTDWSPPKGPPHGPSNQYKPGYTPPPQAAYQYPAQWSPHAPGYQPIFVPARPSNGVAVAALVLGITSIVFSWWGLVTLLQVVLAIVFGSVGISKANRGAANKGLAVAGLVLGLVGLVIYFFIGLFSLGLGWLV